uniref:Similar to GAUT1/LGT1 (Galacturonosyltransferase 1) n=1 Tax=Arundo donax TaxID=35708 RepID=A0A0A9APJ3_ARUDO
MIWSLINLTVESEFSFSFSFLHILYFPSTAELTAFDRSIAAFSGLTRASSSLRTKSIALFSRLFSLSFLRAIFAAVST